MKKILLALTTLISACTEKPQSMFNGELLAPEYVEVYKDPNKTALPEGILWQESISIPSEMGQDFGDIMDRGLAEKGWTLTRTEPYVIYQKCPNRQIRISSSSSSLQKVAVTVEGSEAADMACP